MYSCHNIESVSYYFTPSLTTTDANNITSIKDFMYAKYIITIAK